MVAPVALSKRHFSKRPKNICKWFGSMALFDPPIEVGFAGLRGLINGLDCPGLIFEGDSKTGMPCPSLVESGWN